jgi:hypothetical protein
VPLRPRSVYAGLDAFGDGDGAVLVEPRVSRNLRLAAESATQEGRIAGGLLYGRGFVDEKGAYLVVSGYLEAGPGENHGDRISRGGSDEFTLSEPDLRLLRKDAARMYTSSVEAGWWRSLPAAGVFGRRDLETQAALVGPGGAGLLVFGSGLDWGTAYLGPEARPADTADLVLSAPRLAPESPGSLEPDAVQAPGAEPGLEAGPLSAAEPDLMADLGFHVLPELDSDPGLDPDMELDPDIELADMDLDPDMELADMDLDTGAKLDTDDEEFDDDPELDADEEFDDDMELDDPELDEPLAPAVPVTTLAMRRQPVFTPAPQPTGQREMSPVRKPEREWGVKDHSPSYVGPETPTDVKIVVGLLCLVIIIAAIMIGMLVHYLLAAVIVGVGGLLVVAAFLWFSRL